MTKKPYPTDQAMPYIVRLRYNYDDRYELIHRNTKLRIGIYPDEASALEARRFQLMRDGYEV